MPVAALTALPSAAASVAETAAVPGAHWSVKRNAEAPRSRGRRDRRRSPICFGRSSEKPTKNPDPSDGEAAVTAVTAGMNAAATAAASTE